MFLSDENKNNDNDGSGSFFFLDLDIVLHLSYMLLSIQRSEVRLSSSPELVESCSKTFLGIV